MVMGLFTRDFKVILKGHRLRLCQTACRPHQSRGPTLSGLCLSPLQREGKENIIRDLPRLRRVMWLTVGKGAKVTIHYPLIRLLMIVEKERQGNSLYNIGSSFTSLTYR